MIQVFENSLKSPILFIIFTLISSSIVMMVLYLADTIQALKLSAILLSTTSHLLYYSKYFLHHVFKLYHKRLSKPFCPNFLSASILSIISASNVDLAILQNTLLLLTPLQFFDQFARTCLAHFLCSTSGNKVSTAISSP